MNAMQKFYSLTRGAVYSFLVDSLGYSIYELDELSTDELFDLVPEAEYLNAYRFAKG
jgi:hypothetical protein